MPVMKQLNVGGVTYDTVGEASVTQVVSTGTKIATVTIDGTATDLYAPGGSSVSPATANPIMDGTAAVGSSDKYAREDHVHPTDTSRQATLVSGTNIKTINNESLLGSGNITIQGGGGGATLHTATATLTANGWSAVKMQTVTVQGITGASAVFASPAYSSYDDYVSAGIYCRTTGINDQLNFACHRVPDTSVTVSIVFFD